MLRSNYEIGTILSGPRATAPPVRGRACSRSLPYFKPLEVSFATNKVNIRLMRMGSNGGCGIPVTKLPRHQTVMDVVRVEPDGLDEKAQKVGISGFYTGVIPCYYS